MSRVSGGGADDSEGYHNLAGCLDYRTRTLSAVQKRRLVRTARELGAVLWIRDEEHGGMEEHAHLVLGTDQPLAYGPRAQWLEYLNGGDSMGNDDYHWRPDPLVTVPPPLSRVELVWLAQQAIKAGRLTAAIRRLRTARERT